MKTFRDFRVFDFAYRANRKLGKLGEFHIFLIKPHHKIVHFLKFLSHVIFFGFWILGFKIKVKNIFRDFHFFDSGYIDQN